MSWGMLPEDLRSRWDVALSAREPCVECASTRVWHNGTRLRKASLLGETGVEFFPVVPVRRLRCRDCRARWAGTPERVPSRAHYQPCVVARAIATLEREPDETTSEIARAHGCHRRTLGRWIERVADLAEPPLLGAAVAAEACAPVLPEVPTEIRRVTGSAQMRAQLLRALVVLALLEALASLRGLEPPALAHAAVLVSRMPVSARGLRIRGDPRSPGD